MSIERAMFIFPLEMEPPLQINLGCSTELFRINIKTTSATLSLVYTTLNRIRDKSFITSWAAGYIRGSGGGWGEGGRGWRS